MDRLRKIALRFLKYFKKNIIHKNNPIHSEKTLLTIKNNFLKDNENFAFSKGLNQKKFNEIVNNFFKGYYDDLYQDLINNSTDKCEKLIDSTKKAYNKYLNNLIKILQTINVGEFYTEKDNIQLEKSLHKIGIHKADQLILLDCYYFSKSFPKLIAFITNDGGINSQKEQIYNLLNLPIFNPTDYF